ncbi:hypothetical protein B0H21DRAFT_763188 [Amylocystis lapponica]|nr:hypothetical protein B0H21DRAFT_763188 [Amylocystis lapponica]
MQHPAFYNDDILREIFSHLSPVSSSRRNYHILARAARVSVAFSEPALDVLWTELDSLDPLLNILAVDIDDIRTGKFASESQNLSAFTRSRFLSYARRVHVLDVLSHYPGAVDPAVKVITALASCSAPDESLFPSLTSLRWSQPSPFGRELLAFLSHTLCRLDVGVGRSQLGLATSKDVTLDHLLGTLSIEAPFLQNLTLSGDATSASLQSVANIRHLTRLDISGLDFTPDLLHVCAGIDRLMELSMSLRDLSHDAELNFPDSSAFSTLHSLTIVGPFASIARVLPILLSPHLHTLSLTAQSTQPQRWTDCADLLELLPTHSPYLRTLSLKTALAPPSSGTALRLLDACAPLLALHALASVDLAFRGCCTPLAAPDADIAALARAWPALAHCTLAFPLASAPDAGPTLTALCALSLHCPALHTLQLPLAATMVPRWTPPEMHGLRRLLVVGPGKPVADPLGVARFLASVFPQVEVGWYVGDAGWRAVHEGMCAARKSAYGDM